MQDRPNILLLVTEQHRGDCLGAAGHPVLQTPNMDNIAANGALFERFYSACPTCISARRSILTGQLPQTHGLVGYREGLDWDAPTLPGTLRDHGYQTYFIGRSIHQYPERKRFGYEDMEISGNSADNEYNEWLQQHAPQAGGGWFGGGVMHNDWTARPWHLDEYLHHTNWTVSRALRFLRRRDPSCPFFLTLSFIGAHPPLQPPAFYLERYIRTGVPEPVIGDWAVPPEEGERDLVSPQHVDLKGEALLCARAAYYGLINHIDDQLRRVINSVTGLTFRDTVVVLTSDHGEMLGDHYCWRKSRAYEPSARVPFLIAGPEQFGFGRGRRCREVATHADIMPTLLDLAGAPIPESVDGRSLLPLLQGETTTWRDNLHIEHAPLQHALTDGRWKYIWQVADGAEQLFDLDTDPHECTNLAVRESSRETLEGWRARLVQRLQGRPEGFSDGEQLLAGRPYHPTLPHAGRQCQFQRRSFV